MKSALLIIDVQQALFDAQPAPYEAEQVIARINQLSAKARAQNVPVIWVHHEVADSAMSYQSAGWQLQGDLIATDSDIRVRKTTPDSFLRTDLQQQLEQLGISELVICGYASEFCVDTTTRRAAGLGYPVTLVADAHTTVDKAHATGAAIRQHENASLSAIRSFGVKIQAIPSAEIEFAQ